jgi:ATPase family associated with various cellular activities (AAA)
VSVVAERSWVERNQLHLLSVLAEVRELVEAHVGGRMPAARPREATPEPGGEAFALDAVQAGFNLSDFERLALVMAAGPDLDGEFPATPTFGLALAALPCAHWSATTPGGPLRNWRLVEVGPGPLTAGRLSVSERVLHVLAGAGGDEPALGLTAQPVPPREEVPPSHLELADRVARLLGLVGPDLPVVQLAGGSARATAEIAAVAAAAMGLHLAVLDGRLIPTESRSIREFTRLLEREAVLATLALLIDAREVADPEHLAAVRLLLEQLAAPAAVAVRERLDLGRRESSVVDVTKPSSEEQERHWSAAIGPGTPSARLAAQFDLDTETIRSVVAATRFDEHPDAVWAAVRARTRPRLGSLAERVDGTVSWHDLVLPAYQQELLARIMLHVRHRRTVHEMWGFGRGRRQGSGTATLFTGPSGTGKTLAAQVVASELGLDLFRVDLSSVLSKYIGETEKNLGAVFDAADEGAIVLLFDEADALFGKRSEVKDSHDRYANLEVAYLLQRIEEHRGLVLLTTNLRESLDPAFLRRLRFVVEFPFPDRSCRAEMWRRAIPAQTPTGRLDPEILAALNLSGGGIRNVALAASVLAAEDGDSLEMSHLERAARVECAKFDQPFPPWPVPPDA